MNEEPTSYLVTGATGFIGRHLVTRLANYGASVFCLVSNGRNQLDRLPKVQGVTPVESGSKGFRQTLGGANPDVVINLAAQGVDPSSRDPDSLINGNVGVLVELISGLSESSPRVILHAGSWSEYATTEEPGPITENRPIGPSSIYGAAKASAALFGNALARQAGIPFVTLRLFNVFGVGEPPRRLIPYLVEQLRLSAPADLSPGDQTRDLVYVDDVVDAFLLASKTPLEPFTAYNVCSSRPTEVRWIAETVADIMEKPRTLLRFGALRHREDEPLSVVGDNTRFVAATGWHPQTTVEEGIRSMIVARSDGDPRP
ncbi:MAG: NAD(P)-dependent oxidoreductase [Acidimicrobiia bacterium]